MAKVPAKAKASTKQPEKAPEKKVPTKAAKEALKPPSGKAAKLPEQPKKTVKDILSIPEEERTAFDLDDGTGNWTAPSYEELGLDPDASDEDLYWLHEKLMEERRLHGARILYLKVEQSAVLAKLAEKLGTSFVVEDLNHQIRKRGGLNYLASSDKPFGRPPKEKKDEKAAKKAEPIKATKAQAKEAAKAVTKVPPKAKPSEPPKKAPKLPPKAVKPAGKVPAKAKA